MQETEVQRKFNEATERHRAKLSAANADYFMAALQTAVQQLRDSGMHISMEANPRLIGSAVAPEAKGEAVVNAVVVADGLRIDFVATHDQYEHRSGLHAYIGAANVASFTARLGTDRKWRPPSLIGTNSLEEGISTVIIQSLAERKLVQQYDVDSNTASLGKKTLPAPKLAAGTP